MSCMFCSLILRLLLLLEVRGRIGKKRYLLETEEEMGSEARGGFDGGGSSDAR